MCSVYEEIAIREQFKMLTNQLINRDISISFMESCTSGQLASLITDTEGASAIFKGSAVTYSNEVKIKCGVSAEVLEKYSVYSNETSLEMAKAAQRFYGSDISIGVTGTTGNIDPNNKENSQEGIIYFSILYGNRELNYKISIPAQASRLMYKLAICKEIGDKINSEIFLEKSC